MSYNGMGIIIIGGKKASPWSSGVFTPMVAAAPLGMFEADAQAKWTAICDICRNEVGVKRPADWPSEQPFPVSDEEAGKVHACVLQLGIPAFKDLPSKQDRDRMQQIGSSKFNCAGLVVGPETVAMARQIADQQAPVSGAGAPSPKPPTATAASAALPIVAIAAGAGILWWLLKSKKKS